MVALITGASSGIGRDIARELSQCGYDLILVARRKNRLAELAQTLKTNCDVFEADLSYETECFRLCEYVKNKPIDIFVNNAGCGVCGSILSTDVSDEINMIAVNITAMHILFKHFAKQFDTQCFGTILNVASAAAFMPGPFMAGYYASKSYVLRLSRAVKEELKRKHTNVKICVLCPGPVATEFDSVANVTFSLPGMSSSKVAKIAVAKMHKGKFIIIPGITMKFSHFFAKLIPECIMVKFAGYFQHRKIGER